MTRATVLLGLLFGDATGCFPGANGCGASSILVGLVGHITPDRQTVTAVGGSTVTGTRTSGESSAAKFGAAAGVHTELGDNLIPPPRDGRRGSPLSSAPGVAFIGCRP